MDGTVLAGSMIIAGLVIVLQLISITTETPINEMIKKWL